MLALFVVGRGLCALTPPLASELRLHSFGRSYISLKKQVCHGHGWVFDTFCTLCLGIIPHRLDEETSKPMTRMCHTYSFSWSCGHSQADRHGCLWDDDDDDEPPPETKPSSRRHVESIILCSCLPEL